MTKLTAYLAYLKAWIHSRWAKMAHKHKYYYQMWRMQAILKRNYCKAWTTHTARADEATNAFEAIMANEAAIKQNAHTVTFDMGSKVIGIDNRASAFISGDITDFEGPLQDCNKVVRGFGGTKITNSYYVPGTKDRLLSPQHIPLDPGTNVATIRTAPDYTNFYAFCAEAGFDEPDHDDNPMAFDAALVLDHDDEDTAKL